NNPRVLYLVSSSHGERLGRPNRALVFRSDENSSNQAVVEFLPKDEVDLTNTVRLTSRAIKGCLGLISVENEIFLALVTNATEIGRPSTGIPESAARIHEVSFYSLTSSTWDDLSVGSDSMANAEALESVIRDNYTQTWDLSSRLSRRVAEHRKESKDLATFDERFVWNEYIVRSLLDFRERLDSHEREELDQCHFIILAIQGYGGSVQALALTLAV
ncbi:hypothetical protein MPER_01643, partial [Moniliophthora perniciosa FA553]